MNERARVFFFCCVLALLIKLSTNNLCWVRTMLTLVTAVTRLLILYIEWIMTNRSGTYMFLYARNILPSNLATLTTVVKSARHMASHRASSCTNDSVLHMYWRMHSCSKYYVICANNLTACGVEQDSISLLIMCSDVFRTFRRGLLPPLSGHRAPCSWSKATAWNSCKIVYTLHMWKPVTHVLAPSQCSKCLLYLRKYTSGDNECQKQSVVKKYQREVFAPVGITTSTSFIFLFGASPLWTRASSFTRILYHTKRRTTVGRTPLDV